MKVLDDEKDKLLDHEYDGIRELDNHNLEDKILLLRLSGEFDTGKISDIRFDEI